MRNYFILDGVDSRDFGVYISGQGTFNASGRDYNIIPVPGRNGDLVGPEKRFANGTLTYPAFIYSNFKTNIEAFRNFLLSLVGYHDLVDSYHPDQIRKVLFQGPFNADVQPKNDAGRFDIEFICKPQRFLASGNEVTTFESSGESETYSGSVITFDNPGDATVSALSTAINPVQDLHGYDNPWPAGGGKNLFDFDQTVGTTTIETASILLQPGTYYAYVAAKSSAFYSNVWISSDGTSFSKIGTDSTVQTAYADQELEYHKKKCEITVVSAVYIRFRLSVNTNTQNDRIAIMVTTDSTGYDTVPNNLTYDTASWQAIYRPYSNICPISGFSAANIVVSPTQDAQDGTTYTVSFGAAGTVYGGTLDVVNGTLTVDRAMVDLGTLSWSKFTVTQGTLFRAPIADSVNVLSTVAANAVCSMYPVVSQTTRAEKTLSANTTNYDIIDSSYSNAADFKTAMSGVQLVYELATPTVITLTPTEVQMLLGTNNVWSDTGDITATIAFQQEQFTITNPTLFDSQPFLRVYGAGTLGIGSQSVTITQADEYTDIDCEMMDCYKDGANKNMYVRLSDYNFPVLKPGDNNISLENITKVEITPRWWIV